MKTKKIAILILLPLLLTCFLSVGQYAFAQQDTSIISLSGKDWSLKVDQTLQSSIDSRNTPYMTSKSSTEKELFLQLETLEDCKSGVVQFKVDLQGLTAYKQLPLDKELKLDEYTSINATHAMNGTTVLVYRPENIVNSFALFDDSGHKQAHISATKLVSSDGAMVWCDSNLEGGLLTILLPLKWLEGAKFPVVLDPTFGYNSIGGTCGNWEGTIVGSKYTLTENGDATLLSIYTDADATNDIKIAVYYENYTLIYQSGYQSVVVGGWVNFSLSLTLEAGNYWLASYGAHPHQVFDSGLTDQFLYSYESPFPDPITPVDLEDRKVSIYISYTVAEESTPTPSPSPSPTATPTPSEWTTTITFAITPSRFR